MSKYEFPLPDTGEGLHEAEILSWYVQVGDQVQENDPLVEVQTDKAVVEITSPVTGKVEALGAEQGEVLKVGEILVYLSGVTSSSTLDNKKEEGQKEETKRDSNKEFVNEAKNPGEITSLRRVKAAPSVRKAAREIGVDLTLIQPTGPKGRVLKSDLENYISAQEEGVKEAVIVQDSLVEDAHQDEVVPIKGLRKIIFENMKTASSNAVLCTGMDEVEVSRLVEVRKSLKPHTDSLNINLTYLPFIVRAVAIALKKHRVFNSLINEVEMTLTHKKDINIGIAMATKEGLVVPVIRHADRKTIIQIAAEIDELADKARNKELTSNELMGSTFTISSTGAKGGWYATPIINHPEIAILGVHKIMKQPIVMENNQLGIGYMMGMSITFDHRVIDGDPAGNFMTEVARILHEPEILMLN